MPRKAKKRVHPMPPLSFADKLIYWVIILLLCCAYFALLFLPIDLRHQIAFSDPEVRAVEEHSSLLWLLVPWMTFFLMTFILWLQPYQKRAPIFGKRGFKYGPPAWPKIYPLFMKNKPKVWESPRAQKNRRQVAIILVVLLLVSFIPFPWSLYGRDCLMFDGRIVQYNMFNSQTKEFTAGDIGSVEIEAYRCRTGRTGIKSHWDVRMVLRTDSGKKFIFELRDFQNAASDQYLFRLGSMIQIKGRYDPGIIHYDGVENLNRMIEDKELREEEIRMLYQLFGQ